MKLVVFSANWCKPCNFMHHVIDKYVISHPEVKDRIECLDMNEERNVQLSQSYGIWGIPAMLLVKDEDELNPVLRKHIGVLSAEDFAEFVKAL